MRRFVVRWLSLVLLLGCSPRLYSADASVDLNRGAWTPPENDWPSVVPPEPLVGEGMNEGDVVYDVRGLDQHGDEVSVWQFWDHLVLMDISTMWCAPCQELATGAEEVNQEFKDDGVVFLTVLHENEQNKAPTQEELEIWASFPSFHPDPDHPYDTITAPIVADPKGVSGSIEAIRNNTYPVVLLIGPDMRVMKRLSVPTEGLIIEAVEEALGK